MTDRSSASLQNLGQTARTAPVSAGVRINLARAIVAVGDPTRERLVLEALANSPPGDAVFQIARRCLDADDLMHSVQSGDADVAVVGVDLHGLSAPVIRALAHSRLPLVLLKSDSDRSEPARVLRGSHVRLLEHDADAGEVRDAARSVVRENGRTRNRSSAAQVQRAAVERDLTGAAGVTINAVPPATNSGMIVALIGPLGGPGVSTNAGGLTSALGQTAMVALVDFDLRAPSLALAFDLNPALNLYMVLHETNGSDDPRIWADVLAAELQPLDEESPGARVLVGAPSVGLASAVEPNNVRDLLVHLAAQEQFVVVDLGAECDAHTVPGAAQHAALELADRILVVSRADVLGLGRTRALLDRLRGVVSRPDERLALVLNRHQPRHHHDDIEVARAFRTSVAAVIPDDPGGVQAALAAQRPVGALGCGRRASAARAIVGLAREIRNAGGQPMSAAPARRGEHWSLSALLAFGRHIPRRSHA